MSPDDICPLLLLPSSLSPPFDFAVVFNFGVANTAAAGHLKDPLPIPPFDIAAPLPF